MTESRQTVKLSPIACKNTSGLGPKNPRKQGFFAIFVIFAHKKPRFPQILPPFFNNPFAGNRPAISRWRSSTVDLIGIKMGAAGHHLAVPALDRIMQINVRFDIARTHPRNCPCTLCSLPVPAPTLGAIRQFARSSFWSHSSPTKTVWLNLNHPPVACRRPIDSGILNFAP